jgi:hypothetical protein
MLNPKSLGYISKSINSKAFGYMIILNMFESGILVILVGRQDSVFVVGNGLVSTVKP